MVNIWKQKVKDEKRHAQAHNTQILTSVQPELGGGVTIWVQLQLRPPINSSTGKLLIKAESSTLFWEQINVPSSA